MSVKRASTVFIYIYLFFIIFIYYLDMAQSVVSLKFALFFLALASTNFRVRTYVYVELKALVTVFSPKEKILLFFFREIRLQFS